MGGARRSPAWLAAVLVLSCVGCGADDRRVDGRVPADFCAPGTLDAQGSSAQRNAMELWIDAYQRSCRGSVINYEPSGSGAGIKAFIAGNTDFAGSESALDEKEQAQADTQCSGGRAVGLPMVIGPVAVAYHLAGVTELRLTPATIAKIFAGAARRWDDPAIRSDNPDSRLPPTPIRTVHREESSGTTETFTRFLTKAAPRDWAFGADREWKAPGGAGVSGSERVADTIERTDGAIGYLELSSARADGLAVAGIGNASGRFVPPSPEGAARSLGEPGADLRVRVDDTARDPDAYPIVLVTYEIICDRGYAADEAPLVKGFLGWTASDTGQDDIKRLGFAPLPGALRGRVQAAVAELP